MYVLGESSNLGDVNFSVRTSRDVVVEFARIWDFWLEVNLFYIHNDVVLFSLSSCHMKSSFMS